MVSSRPPEHQWTTSETNRLLEIIAGKERYIATLRLSDHPQTRTNPKEIRQAIKLCGVVIPDSEWMTWVKNHGWVKMEKKAKKKGKIVSTDMWDDAYVDPVRSQLARLETEFIALKIKLGGYLTKESQPPGSVFAQRWISYHADAGKAWFFMFLKIISRTPPAKPPTAASTTDSHPSGPDPKSAIVAGAKPASTRNKEKRKAKEAPHRLQPLAKRPQCQPCSPSILAPHSTPAKQGSDSEDEDVVYVGENSRSQVKGVPPGPFARGSPLSRSRRRRALSIIDLASSSEMSGGEGVNPNYSEGRVASSHSSIIEVPPKRPNPISSPKRLALDDCLPPSRAKRTVPTVPSRPTSSVRPSSPQASIDPQLSDSDHDSDADSPPCGWKRLLPRENLERSIAFTTDDTLMGMFSDPNIRPQQAWRALLPQSPRRDMAEPSTTTHRSIESVADVTMSDSAVGTLTSNLNADVPPVHPQLPVVQDDIQTTSEGSEEVDMDIESDGDDLTSPRSARDCEASSAALDLEGGIALDDDTLVFLDVLRDTSASEEQSGASNGNEPGGHEARIDECQIRTPGPVRPETPPLPPDTPLPPSPPCDLAEETRFTVASIQLMSQPPPRPARSALVERFFPNGSESPSDSPSVRPADTCASAPLLKPDANQRVNSKSASSDRLTSLSVADTSASPEKPQAVTSSKHEPAKQPSVEAASTSVVSRAGPTNAENRDPSEMSNSDVLVSTWKVSSSIIDLLLTQLRLHPSRSLADCLISFSVGHLPFKPKLSELVSVMGGFIHAPKVLCHPGWVDSAGVKRYLVGPVGRKPSPGLPGINQLDVIEFIALIQQKLLKASQ